MRPKNQETIASKKTSTHSSQEKGTYTTTVGGEGSQRGSTSVAQRHNRKNVGKCVYCGFNGKKQVRQCKETKD